MKKSRKIELSKNQAYVFSKFILVRNLFSAHDSILGLVSYNANLQHNFKNYTRFVPSVSHSVCNSWRNKMKKEIVPILYHETN